MEVAPLNRIFLLKPLFKTYVELHLCTIMFCKDSVFSFFSIPFFGLLGLFI